MIALYAGELPSRPVSAQLARTRAYCQGQGYALGAVEELTDDDPGSFRMALRARPGGGELLRRASKGDLVVVASVLVLGPTRAEFLKLARAWQLKGVTLHVADDKAGLQCHTDEEWATLIGVLAAADQLDRGCRAEQIRRGVAKLKARGGRVSRWPPLGHRWEWSNREGRYYAVPDEAELRVVARIIAWRDQGHSWGEIAAHLVRHQITTASGGEWHPRRCQLAVKLATEGRLPLPQPARGDLDKGEDRPV